MSLEKARALFVELVANVPQDQWAARLEQLAGGDDELRRQVSRILGAHREAGNFLESPAPTLGLTPDEPPERAGAAIGPYKLLEQIGEGGFGVVFLAEQTQPVRRKVALKVLKPGMDSRQVVARFEAERQALAIMDHPNIARVFDGGTTASGRPYFVMELVRGIPVTEFCDQNRLTPRQRLELFLQVCGAVQHAHQKGIIHRDIKPNNVLVSRHDTTPVAKVIDFGVAKALGQALTDKTLFTGVAQMVGTPLYMSPEQAGMSDLDVDTRSDIYSLGVLLYELLTGTTPFTVERLKTATFDEIRRIIREEEPPRPSARLSTATALPSIAASRGLEPRKLSGIVRGELDWIVMKALEKDRNRRYETTNSFALDVQRYLHDEPVQACPPSTWYRFGKFARRNRREVLIAGAAAAVAATGVVGLAVSRALIARALESETNAKEALRVEVYFQRITVAHRELSIDNLAAALRALQDCPVDLRGWEWYYLMRLCKVDPLVLPVKADVRGLAFSPDGERIASAGGDGTIKIWDSRTGELLRALEAAHADSACSIAFHPGGNHLASRGGDLRLRVWDLTTGRDVFNKPCDALRKFGTGYTVAFSPDGRYLATGSEGTVRVWDWKHGQPAYTCPGHEALAVSVAFSRNGQFLASASTGEGVKLWDAGTGGLVRTLPPHRHPVGGLAFSPDGGQLAEASFGRCVNLWDTTTGELRRTLPHAGNVECVAFSPDGSRLVSGGEDKTLHLWDPTTGREVLALRGHASNVECVAFSPEPAGRRFASASTDGTIRVWDATPLRENEGPEVFTFDKHEDEIWSVVFGPDGRRIASAGIGTLVKTWDAATGVSGVEIDVHANVVFCLAWQPPDGRRIASASWDGQLHTVQVRDARNGENAFALPPGPECYAVAFSPDGRYLVTGIGSAVQVWDGGTGQRIGTLGTHKREIRGLVFSPNGGHLASASDDGEVKLWDATRLGEKQEPRLTLPARVPGPSLNVAFGPDAQWLATGGEENTVKIWDVGTGRELRPPLRGHTGEVYAVAVSPDGRWIASGGEDSTVKVWDVRNEYRLVRRFRGHTGLVSSLAFSPDGRRLVSGSRDKTVKLWDVSELGQKPNE